MERLCQTRSRKGRYEWPRVEDHCKRQGEIENINNESGRSSQVTWTPARKGAGGRRSWYEYIQGITYNDLINRQMCWSNAIVLCLFNENCDFITMYQCINVVDILLSV